MQLTPAPPPADEFLSTNSEWFKLWLDAFGTEQSGVWRPAASAVPVEIPYQRLSEKIGPLAMACASGATNAHTPRYDIIGELMQPASMLGTMMADLDVNFLCFSYLSLQSRLANAITRATGVLHHIDSCESAPFVDCTDSWDEYWKSRGKSRTEWGRRERRLMEDQGAQFACLTEWNQIAPQFDALLEIEASGWKGKEGSAIMQSPQTLAFYTACAKAWAAAGTLRIFVLYLERTPIAFEMNVQTGGRLNCVKHGYLEQHAKQGPGQVLRIQVLKWAFERPDVTLFDMFGPSTEAKMKWATGTEALYTIRVFRRNLLGLLAWFRYAVAPKLKAKLGAIKAKNDASPSAT